MLRNNNNPNQNTEDMDETESRIDSISILAPYEKSVDDDFANDDDSDEEREALVNPGPINEIPDNTETDPALAQWDGSSDQDPSASQEEGPNDAYI